MASEGTAGAGLRSALWLPIFDGLADPVAVARLAAEAEEAGWHGFFVWDHLSWRAPVREVSDPWITPATPYDIAVARPPGTDLAPYATAGATWWLTEFEPGAVSLDHVRGVLRDGPA